MRAAIESWLHQQWSKRGLLAWCLSPFALIYLAIFRAKAHETKPVQLPVPVVVVGNIYVGGTGKTPITIQLVRELRLAGYTPGVISRGYGRRHDLPEVVEKDSPAEQVGDEPLLIEHLAQCPVVVGRDRVAAGRLMLEKFPKVNLIVSDDGLQHLRLARDVELAVVGARGLGNGWVLPAGPLREPPSRLDSVDAIILNATTDTVASRTPRFAATSQFGTVINLATGTKRHIDALAHDIEDKKAKVLAAAGIASPDRFYAMLRAHDIECSTLDLGDHFNFRTNPFARRTEDFIFVTGKDAVKCRQNPEIVKDQRIWVVDLEIQLDPYLVEFLIGLINERRPDAPVRITLNSQPQSI